MIELVEVGGKYVRWDDMQVSLSTLSPRSTAISFLSSNLHQSTTAKDGIPTSGSSSTNPNYSSDSVKQDKIASFGKVASRGSGHAPSLPALSEMREEEGDIEESKVNGVNGQGQGINKGSDRTDS